MRTLHDLSVLVERKTKIASWRGQNNFSGANLLGELGATWGNISQGGSTARNSPETKKIETV
jgi:hypothetical protein